MNDLKFIITVGISGSGKSKWVENFKNDSDFKIVLPDNIRRDITGDVSNQTKNKEVFRIANDLVVNYLNNDYSVIFDATNLVSQHRKNFLDFLKQNVKKDFTPYCKIFYADPEICKKRIENDLSLNVDRSKVSGDVIDKQYKQYMDDINKIEFDGYELI